MSSPPDMVASQFFFYLRRNDTEAAYAFESSEGITVPIFSSMELARAFLEQARVRSHGVAMISPTQMSGFSTSCREAGAKFLQLDPLPAVLKKARSKNIGGPVKGEEK